jgi:DNA-binding NarL/FixJ family response regulator
MSVEVLLAEDQPVVRAGIRALLEATGRFSVAGEADDGPEAVEAMLRLRPAVGVFDVGLPRESGIGAVRRIRAAWPEARVLMLSVHRDAEYVRAALEAGAAGYVLKWTPAAVLLEALDAVAGGGSFLDPAAAREAILAPQTRPLSPREREVLRLLANGRSTKEAAAALGLSPKTVETHRAHIMDKLGIRDLAGLVRHAIREGLVGP